MHQSLLPLRGAAADRELPSAPGRRPPVACLVHVFYAELWPELARYIGNFGRIPVSLRVNIAADVAGPGLLRRIRRDFPDALTRISPNRGRDIGGYFALMSDFDFDAHEIVCLVHTKKSPHLWFGGGRRWRRRLLDALLCDTRRAAENVAAFHHDPRLGMIGAARLRCTDVTANSRRYQDYLDLLDIRPEHRDCEFVAGTMMLVRSTVLQRLYAALKDVPFESGDTPLESHLDGQIAHAIERVIGNVVRDSDLRTWWR